jgi:hypothetical protein
MKTVYACEGTCKGIANEEQWNAGAKNCATNDCTLFQKPLKKRIQCEHCGAVYTPEEKHACVR